MTDREHRESTERAQGEHRGSTESTERALREHRESTERAQGDRRERRERDQKKHPPERPRASQALRGYVFGLVRLSRAIVSDGLLFCLLTCLTTV